MTTLKDYNVRGVGIGWYRKEDYLSILRMFEDSDNLPRTWEEWLKGAEKLENEFKADGYIVERVNIDPDTFPDWCRATGRRINAQARQRFAGEAVARQYGRSH